MKEFWKSKTMWINFAIGVVALVIATLETAPIEPKTAAMVLGGLSSVNMFLRSITSTAIGK